ncbi:DUF4386 domain-containing protein [Blastococcus deserti]|uniref:DUF4386 domain-containing protein n=1 Tax=Blastococcus deserti TaxID=2259033 RepID=A0ABW4X8S3_9ACTN
MSHAPLSPEGVVLRRAALIAAFSMLLGLGVPVAEFVLRPMLIIPANIEQTIRNIGADPGLFAALIFAYFIAFVADVVVAWALYFLLAPVNPALSMLTSLFRLVYAVLALGALLNLATVFRALRSPESLANLGSEQLNAQVVILLNSFSWQWGLGLTLFGVHLVMLGHLVYRSGYIPRPVGLALVLAGLGYLVYYVQPYLYPDGRLPFFVLTITGLGELVFLLWLLLRGWKIPEPTRSRETIQHPTQER